jgi:hypothetical protein
MGAYIFSKKRNTVIGWIPAALKDLSDAKNSDLTPNAGLQAFSDDKDSVTTHWVAPNETSRSEQEENFKEFAAVIKTLNRMVGRSGKQAKQRIDRALRELRPSGIAESPIHPRHAG